MLRKLDYRRGSIVQDKKEGLTSLQIHQTSTNIHKLILGGYREKDPGNTFCVSCGKICKEAQYRYSITCCNCGYRITEKCMYCERVANA